MWKLTALLLVSVALEIAAISPGATATGELAAVNGDMRVKSAQMELDGAGEMAEAKRHTSQAALPLMLRREEATAAELGDASLQEQTSITTANTASLTSQGSVDVNQVSLADLSSNDDSEGDGKKKKHKKTPPVVDRFQFIKEFLPGPIPESQKPGFIIAFLVVMSAVGFIVHFSYQQKEQIKEEQQAAMQRKMLRMRSAAKGAAAFDGSMAPPRAEMPVPGDEKLPLPSKSMGKGIGGKVGAKAFGKGQVTDSSSAAAPATASGPVQLHRPVLTGAAGLGLGRNPSSESAPEQTLSPTERPILEKSQEPRSSVGGTESGAAVELEVVRKLKVNVATVKKSEEAPKQKVNVAVVKNADNEPAKSAGKGKGNGKKENGTKLEELLSMLRAVEKIQAMFRRWKAAQKLPVGSQRITLVCDVLEGADMPNVNRFGGCDPFIECRIVRGDPTNCLRGDIDKAALLTMQTDVKRNDMAPSWQQRLEFAGLIYEKDLYVQLVLWDYNLARNQPIGHAVLPLEQAIVSHAPRRPERALSFSPLPGCEGIALKTKVSAQFAFWEEHRHRLVVVGGSWLPKVKMLGTISSYVEARVLRGDPRKVTFHTQSGDAPECLWSGRTNVVQDNVDPNWEQEFNFTLACEVASLWLQLVLWDANAPRPDVPIGHAVVKISQAVQPSCAGDLVEHDLRLEDLPERHLTTDLSRATLAVRMGCETV